MKGDTKRERKEDQEEGREREKNENWKRNTVKERRRIGKETKEKEGQGDE